MARSHLSDKSPNRVCDDATLLSMLVKQETESLKCGAEILIELYTYKCPNEERFRETESKLLSVLNEVLLYFLTITSKNQQDSWTPLLCLIFDQGPILLKLFSITDCAVDKNGNNSTHFLQWKQFGPFKWVIITYWICCYKCLRALIASTFRQFQVGRLPKIRFGEASHIVDN